MNMNRLSYVACNNKCKLVVPMAAFSCRMFLVVLTPLKLFFYCLLADVQWYYTVGRSPLLLTITRCQSIYEAFVLCMTSMTLKGFIENEDDGRTH